MRNKTGGLRCDGTCATHTGIVVRVHVFSRRTDWGEFDYCEAAIASDRENGLRVEIVTPENRQKVGEK